MILKLTKKKKHLIIHEKRQLIRIIKTFISIVESLKDATMPPIIPKFESIQSKLSCLGIKQLIRPNSQVVTLKGAKPDAHSVPCMDVLAARSSLE